MNPIIQFVLGIIGLGVFLLFTKGFQIMAEEEGIGSAIGFFFCCLPIILSLPFGMSGGGGGGGGSKLETYYDPEERKFKHKIKLK